ncbi:MAG: SDR family oxidoreductase [Rhodospirillales bacterium]|nr:SDR family oxidoreductase [Rhodospirillales bacterium]
MTELSGLNGAVAIVTGSAQNIGRAIALSLAAAGAGIVVNARTSKDAAQGVADEINEAGGKAIVHMADVSNPDQVDSLINAAIENFGRLDILVNNVALRMAAPITETSYEDWRNVISNTLDSAFLCSRAAVPHLAVHGQGAIVNIGGVSGHAGVANRSAVAAAKAGLAGMTGSLGIELAPLGITVNCVSPGYIDTHRDGHVPVHFQQKPVPVGRKGGVNEVAAMVRFLCGPDGRYVTGQTIHVAGGWHISIS